MATFSDTRDSPVANYLGVGRVRTRCAIGAAIAGTGYVATFVADIVRGTPSDDSIVYGLELGFAAVAVVCALVTIMVWMQSSHVEYTLSMYSLIKRAHDRNELEAAAQAASEHGCGSAVPITSAPSRRISS